MGLKNKAKKSRRKNQREKWKPDLFESDGTFAFIEGHTSGGVPYGITWEEMEEIERKEKEELEPRKSMQCNEDMDLPFY